MSGLGLLLDVACSSWGTGHATPGQFPKLQLSLPTRKYTRLPQKVSTLKPAYLVRCLMLTLTRFGEGTALCCCVNLHFRHGCAS